MAALGKLRKSEGVRVPLGVYGMCIYVDLHRSAFEEGWLEKKGDWMMDMEEVYLRQITEHLKKLNELQETNNDLLTELLQKLSN